MTVRRSAVTLGLTAGLVLVGPVAAFADVLPTDPVPTDSATPLPTDEPSVLPTETGSPLPTDSPSALPSDTASPLPTDSPSAQPSETATATPTTSPSGGGGGGGTTTGGGGTTTGGGGGGHTLPLTGAPAQALLLLGFGLVGLGTASVLISRRQTS